MYRNLATALLLIASAASAEILYVDLDGSDSGSSSRTDPWRTIQHAVDEVVPGDEIRVRTGSYAGARIESSGTRKAPIALRTDTGAALVLD